MARTHASGMGVTTQRVVTMRSHDKSALATEPEAWSPDLTAHAARTAASAGQRPNPPASLSYHASGVDNRRGAL